MAGMEVVASPTDSAAAAAREKVLGRIVAATAAWANGMALAAIRDSFDELFSEAAGAAVEEFEIGPMRAAWIDAPAGRTDRVVLHCHGGGYQVGSIRSHLGIASRLAAAARARVLAFDYRLAPEHRFPSAAEDAFAAYRWLLDRHGAPASVAGDSAGGALALAAAIQARDAGLPPPDCIVLMSPWLDLTMRGDSYDSLADLDVFSKPDQLRAMARTYLGRGASPAHPLASPVEADLARLPPVLVHAGDRDITLDDSILFAARARAAGCSVELTVFEGMCHHFQVFEELAEAAASVTRIGSFVERWAATGPRTGAAER